MLSVVFGFSTLYFAPKSSTKLQAVLSGVIIKMHVRVVLIMEKKSTGLQVVPNS